MPYLIPTEGSFTNLLEFSIILAAVSVFLLFTTEEFSVIPIAMMLVVGR